MRYGLGRPLVAATALVILLYAATTAHGVVFGFRGITLNDAEDTAAAVLQLRGDVVSVLPDQVQFTFHNIGPYACTIAQIFFEEGPLADMLTIASSSGVSFQEGGSPKHLPGGNDLADRFDTTFRMSADSPAAHNGVNNSTDSSEWVSATFSLAPGKTFQDVQQMMIDGRMRIGIHVQGFASGNSDSFINDPHWPPVPEPTAIVLNLAGLAAACGFGGQRRLLRIGTR